MMPLESFSVLLLPGGGVPEGGGGRRESRLFDFKFTLLPSVFYIPLSESYFSFSVTVFFLVCNFIPIFTE